MKDNFLLLSAIFIILASLLIANNIRTTGDATDVLQGSSVVRSDFVYSGIVLAEASVDGLVFVHSDRLSSNVLRTDASSFVVSSGDYGPYGDNNNVDGDFDYSGKLKTKTSTVNLGAREYNPQIRRFSTPDPILQDTASAYNYANNNPLKYIDPDGKQVKIAVNANFPKHIKSPEANIKQLITDELSSPLFTRVLGFDLVSAAPDTLQVYVGHFGKSVEDWSGFYSKEKDAVFINYDTSFSENPDSSLSLNLNARRTLIHEIKHFVDARDTTANIEVNPNNAISTIPAGTDSLKYQGMLIDLFNYFDGTAEIEHRAYITTDDYIKGLLSTGEIDSLKYKELMYYQAVGYHFQVVVPTDISDKLLQAIQAYGDSAYVEITIPKE